MSEGNATTFLESTPAATTEQTNPNTQEGEFLQRLVGEGKKYKSTEEVAKAYVHAVEFIDQLKEQQRNHEAELQNLREIAKLKENLEQKVERLEQVAKSSEVIAPELVAKLVNETLDKRSFETKAKENKKLAWDKLTEIYGDLNAAKNAVTQYVGGNDHKKDFVNQSAVTDPESLVELIKSKIPVKTPQGVDQNIENGTVPDVDFEKQVEGLTWSKAQEIKKKDPKLYRSMKFQLKLHEAAGKEGFFNN